jgi:CcmD family protein
MEPVYIVLIITVVIWLGIFAYMFHLDKQIDVLKRMVNKFEKTGNK